MYVNGDCWFQRIETDDILEGEEYHTIGDRFYKNSFIPSSIFHITVQTEAMEFGVRSLFTLNSHMRKHHHPKIPNKPTNNRK